MLFPALFWSCKEKPVIVCFGDSLTEGRGAKPSEAWPALLSKRVKAKVINAGISGDTTMDALERIDEVLALNPDVVVVEFGANDFLKAFNAGEDSPANVMLFEIKNRLGEILEKLDDGSRKLYLVKFFNTEMIDDFPTEPLGPSGDIHPGFIFDSLFDSLEAEYRVEIIDDIWSGVWGNPALMSDDIHPNAAGYRIMAEHYFSALKPFLKSRDLLR
ncbi:MAG: GDSL-type esterase/lipase family protein [Spirochaetales bacterium]|jgi:acyl-CoA thioesterase-1|nr:GDSL-type esterase/lipase family protein [Spirochaetales bacterium]